ncbi:MAG: hypothetical protein COA32_00210 [Fluviicola sp.]|nr:MAG: hypothetical protein COA32_00210 [Fluviicola sp.]
MKTFFILSLILFTFGAYAQQNITSVSNGLATDPFVWDCTCIPLTGDNITINHDIQMNTDWLVNGSGSITVSNSGSLVEDSEHRGILFDGGVVFTNHGTTVMTNFAFANGAEAHNHGALSLDSGLYVDQNSTFMNHGLVEDIDSTYTQGMFMNEGTYGPGDFLNEGMMTNTGYITADSLLNTGTLNTSAGNLTILDFGNTGTLNVTGSSYIIVTDDFWNSGHLYLAAGRDIRVANDMSNAHQSGTASIDNDGLIEIANDFTNTDTLRGSGVFCIANNSLNTGDVKETLDICDNTSVSHFDANTGNIEPTVTNCTSGCSVGVDENIIANNEISIYPNPASTVLNIESNDDYQMMVVDVMGNIVLNQKVVEKIDVSHLKTGVYFIRFTGKADTKTMKFIKK